MNWIKGQPATSGIYLVAREGCPQCVGQARWQSRNQVWKFPSAQMGFTPTHWMPMPEAPLTKLRE